MYLVFIDESGNSKAPRQEIRNPGGTTLFLTFAAVIVDMKTTHTIESKMNDFKKNTFRDRFLEAKFSVKVEKLKSGLDLEQYRHSYGDLVEKFDFTLISVVINKFQAAKIEGSIGGMYKLGFQTLLKSLRDFQATKSFAEIALIVDSINDNHDQDVLFGYQEALKSFENTPGFYKGGFHPSIIFAKSTHTIGLQIVDYCAGAIQRSVESEDPIFASKIKSKLFRSDTGRVNGFGYKQVPEKNNGPGGATSLEVTQTPISSPTAST